LYAIKTP
jgi:hypothetical protein